MSPSLRRIRIGTRGSALARWQAEHVAAALGELPGAPDAELVLIRTEGDRIQDVPLSQMQGKAFFTKEIEEALLADRVDVAVHSLKDLATAMPAGLRLGAVMKREDPRDALLLAPSLPEGTLETLPRGSRVGTGSLRRRALLAHLRPDLELLDLRGNVPTRIRKLDRGEYDAIVLAAAGVKRLGLHHRISTLLDPGTFVPAVSQGAIGVQVRDEDDPVASWVAKLEDTGARVATAAERAFLRRVEGGCKVPVGAFGRLEENGLGLRGVICSLDGRRRVTGERRGSPEEAESMGTSLAEELLRGGGEEILEAIRGENVGE